MSRDKWTAPTLGCGTHKMLHSQNVARLWWGEAADKRRRGVAGCGEAGKQQRAGGGAAWQRARIPALARERVAVDCSMMRRRAHELCSTSALVACHNGASPVHGRRWLATQLLYSGMFYFSTPSCGQLQPWVARWPACTVCGSAAARMRRHQLGLAQGGCLVAGLSAEHDLSCRVARTGMKYNSSQALAVLRGRLKSLAPSL
jgi:hypothetical protein